MAAETTSSGAPLEASPGVSSQLSPERSAEVVRNLERLLDRESGRLDRRRTELGEVRDAVRALVRETPLTSVTPRADLEVVPADIAPSVAGALLDEIGPDGLLRYATCAYDVSHGLDDERIRDLQPRMGKSGLRARALYPLSMLDSPAGRRWLAMCAETGEEQRFIAEPPSDFLIVGSVAVLASAEWGDPNADRMIIRDPMLIRMFTALYDTSFSMAVALRAVGRPGSVDDRLIDLMALGLKDEAIARVLGSSLRTVRRRIAALMDELGVDTRFQLGAALHAANRLSAGPPPSRRAPLLPVMRTPLRR